MAGNYDELMARKAELEAEAARVAAEQAALANANGADVAAAATSEFDNNVDLVQSQQARMLSQSEPWLLADNFKGIDTAMASDAAIDASANYQLTDQFESPFDAASNQFDLMTDANGYPLDGHTMDSIKKATDAKVAEVHARPKTEPAIYPEQAARYPSKGYMKNPELYRKVHGDAAADEQLRLYNISEAGQQASAFDELVVAASQNETLIAEKEAIAKKAEQFEDDPGFDLYQRNRKAFVIQYGEDKANFYDIALGKNKTVLAQMQDEAKEKGYYDANGFNQSELGSALNFKAAATETSSAASMVADAQAKFNTQTETADQEFMTTSFQNIIKPSSDNYRDEEGDETTTTAEIKTTAEKIFKGSDVNPNEATKQLAELPKLKTQEDKANWLSNIRSFYSENPEIAHAMVRAAAAYLRTGKWYEAAAAGLEGGIEGAGVKYAKDQHALAAEKAELSRQEGLRGKYTAASVNAYLESGNIRDLVIDRAQEASTLRNTYTGPSVNAYIKSGNPEDLILDFAKVDKNYEIYLNKSANAETIAKNKVYAKYYNELSGNNKKNLTAYAETFVKNAKEMYTKMGADGKAFGDKQSAGIETGDVMTMLFDYTQQTGPDGEYLLPRGPLGEYDYSNIPDKVYIDMQNIVENFSRQQYRNFQMNGGVIDTNFNFANYYDQYKLQTSLVNNEATRDYFNASMFETYTTDSDGDFAGEAMIQGSSNITDQIFAGKFDVDSTTEGVQKPTKEQIWKQLAIQWEALSKEDKEVWNKSSLKETDIPTSGFLFFANTLIQKGERHEWMASRNIQLFQDPYRDNK